MARGFTLIPSRVDGIEVIMADSALAFGRHTHDEFGIGFIERGAQKSASGRGVVEAGAGDLITVNPGEVHDGKPFDASGRRWRMLYVDPARLQDAAADVAPGSVDADTAECSDGEVIRHAVLVNLLNPKLSMFFLAFLPQFIAADDSTPTVTMVQLSAIFMALTFAVFALYGAFAARMREQVLDSPTAMIWLRRSFAATLSRWARSSR